MLMRKIIRTVFIGVLILTGTIGKGVLTAERFSLPDFSFLKVNQVFEESDFDPRNGNGQVPLNLEEAKKNLCQIFYSGLADVLKNRDLPIITETLRQIEKVLDLASKVLGYPLSVIRFPFVPVILPTLKDFLEKLFSTINQATTSLSRVNSAATFSLLPTAYCLISFSFSLLTLSKIVLRL